MTIKQATLIALCGNAAILVINLLAQFNIIRFYAWGTWFSVLTVLASTGTLVIFLFTLYRKQP